MHSYTVKMYSRFENLLPNEGSKNGFENSPHHWRQCRGSWCANLVMIMCTDDHIAVKIYLVQVFASPWAILLGKIWHQKEQKDFSLSLRVA